MKVEHKRRNQSFRGAYEMRILGNTRQTCYRKHYNVHTMTNMGYKRFVTHSMFFSLSLFFSVKQFSFLSLQTVRPKDICLRLIRNFPFSKSQSVTYFLNLFLFLNDFCLSQSSRSVFFNHFQPHYVQITRHTTKCKKKRKETLQPILTI